MARGRKPLEPIQDSQLQGLKYLDRLMPVLERLRPVGCERDKAGNRELFFDHYCGLVLLYLFNPLVSSLRAIQQASELKKVQKKLGCPRASLGSLSEAVQVFEPRRLREIVQEMIEQLPDQPDATLGELGRRLTAVDGSVLVALPQITQASYLAKKQGPAPLGWRLHTHFEILRGIPTRVALTDASNQGAANEKTVLRQSLEPDRCYVTDRGYEQFALWNAIVDAGSSYVCRIRLDHARNFAPDEVREVSAQAQAAGVLSDQVGTLGSEKSRRIEHPHHRVRLVRLACPLHPNRRGKPSARPAPQELVLATNLLDVPAEILGVIYRQRWLIELFFRFFKHVLGCRHLLSSDPRGIEIQTYCAIIACLLIALVSGKKPSLRTYEMICYYFIGLANEDELLAHLSKLPVQTV